MQEMNGKEEFSIALTGLRFYSRIGVMEQEREIGNEFVVDVEVETDASRFEDEKLSTTISYAEIYEEVKAVMGEEWLLLETVVRTIATRIAERWNAVRGVQTSVTKLAAPIAGISGGCRVCYRIKKSEKNS